MKTLVNGYQPPLDNGRAYMLAQLIQNIDLDYAATCIESNPISKEALALMMPTFNDLLRLVEYMAGVGFLLRRIVQDCAETDDKTDELLERIDELFFPVALNMFSVIGENIVKYNRKEVTK